MRFAKELPPQFDKFKTETTISQGDASALKNALEGVGDRYLAKIYAELPTFARMSILADELEREIVDRFLEQNLMIPKLDDAKVPVVS